MRLGKQVLFALGFSLVFLIIHILIAYFKPGDLSMLILTLAVMVCMQVFAYGILKRNTRGRPLKFTDIFFFLSLTMVFSVLLLAFNSAYNPYVEQKPLNISEILISLLIFPGIFTGIVTSVIWFAVARKQRVRP